MIITNYEKCTYCGACVQICPRNCITIKESVGGFRFPTVDETLCVNCKKCEAVCPIDKTFQKQVSTAFAAVTKDSNMLKKASSGGLFGAISTYVLRRDGIVYGCAFSDSLEAKHIRVETTEDLPKLFGSKYVQSNTDNTYISVKKDLERGKLVVYSGTPCQIAGLRCFLGKEYQNLVLIDIICHGVPSQAYFDKYLKWLENLEHSKVIDYQFRSKLNHGWSLAGEYSMVDSSDNITTKKLFYFDHYYYYYFLESSIYRECCYTCKYANMNRMGDFTLGDLWGAESLQLAFNIKNGCSLVIANTSKANRILNDLDIFKCEIGVEKAIKYNEQLSCPSKRPPERDERIKDYHECTADELQRAFINNNKLARVKGRMKYMIPCSVARVINMVRFRFH